MDAIKKPRGFAAISPERRKEIARMGGRSVKPENRSFSQNRELAADAGKKGGSSIPPEKRAFSLDADLAKSAGTKGGSARSKAQG